MALHADTEFWQMHDLPYLFKIDTQYQPNRVPMTLLRRVFILFCLFGTFSAMSQAQDSLTAQQAYEYLQNERHRARLLAGEAESPPADSLQKAMRILDEALIYYHRPEILELAKNDESLFYRKTDILLDLSVLQLKAGQPATAAENLRQILPGKHEKVIATIINQNSLFAPVWKDSVMAPTLSKYRALHRVFGLEALNTPYAPNMSEAEKLAGLAKFWSEAKYNFAFFDQVPDLDWDQLYLDYIPKVRATRSTLEYLRVMQEFCAHLQDGHTGIWADAPPLADSIYGRPALLATLVEDKVLVDEVFSDSLTRLGIRPGVEIVRIDGAPVHEYASQHVRPYQSGSTPQNVDVATYTYDLLRGPKDQSVEVTFLRNDREFRCRLPRSGYSDYRPTPDFRFQLLPGNIAYVALNSFGNDNALKGFDAAFDSISATEALILDVRRNGGGDSGHGWNILGYLTDSAFQTSAYSFRLYSPIGRAKGEGIYYETGGPGHWSVHGEKLYTKPVVVLIGHRTFSAAEDFVAVFDAMQRGKLMGEPTGGSTGWPLAFNLPGGLKARVCMKRDTYPDGREWVGIGLQPDVAVSPKVEDHRAGRDTVLEAAIEYLQGSSQGQ